MLWRASSGCLPTNAQLRAKHVDIDKVCGGADETITNILGECPLAEACWRKTMIFVTRLIMRSEDGPENRWELLQVFAGQFGKRRIKNSGKETWQERRPNTGSINKKAASPMEESSGFGNRRHLILLQAR